MHQPGHQAQRTLKGTQRVRRFLPRVAIIKSTTRLEAAQELVDYLLSEEVEIRLAKSGSRQIPLGQVDVESLPVEVQRLRELAGQGVDLRNLRDARSDCLSWLQTEYLR